MSNLLGCHPTFLDNENVWLLWENCQYFQMCEMVMGTPHCVDAGVGTPCNSCICVRQLCLIWRHVRMIFCFLMEPNDCHIKIPWLNRVQFVTLCVCPHVLPWQAERVKPETLPPRGCSADKLPNTASLAAACNCGAVNPGYVVNWDSKGTTWSDSLSLTH
jgi:hypothetical protein